MRQRSGAARPGAKKAHKFLEQAIAAYESGVTNRARKLARRANEAGPDLFDATRLVQLLRALDLEKPAENLADRTVETLVAAAASAAGDGAALAEYGHFLLELNRRDLAEPLLIQAHESGQLDGRAELLLLGVMLERGEVDKLLQIWQRFLDETEDPARHAAVLVKALGHFGHRDRAEEALRRAEPHFAEDRETFEAMLANLRGIADPEQQGTDAARMFDEIADGYDSNLQAIGNAGPAMIGRLLEQIDLPAEGRLEMLDAGCGSGLCAPYLRPYAASIHGCDVSVKMLELCKGKHLYDLLTRTDLNVAATFPQGPFDLVASGDVLVYFGDLHEVIGNIGKVLKPGGWFLFTFEDCSEEAPAAGHVLRTSGRYAHGYNYVCDLLGRAGFSRPTAEFRDVLRHEFGQPVPARAVAARKLAVFDAS